MRPLVTRNNPKRGWRRCITFRHRQGAAKLTSITPVAGDSSRLLPDSRDFSLVLGGPLFQLLRRAHLADDALMLVRQRVIVIALFAWLPLLVLSALEGQVLGGSAAVPFLLDVEVHVRFLVALPLLIIAELVVHQRMRPLRAAIPGTQFDSRERHAAVRGRHRVGVQAAQLGARRGAADRLRIWRRHPDRLAPLHRARHGDVVRDTVRRWLEALARRDVVWLREPADLPVPAVSAGIFDCSSGRAFSGRCHASS